MATDGGYYVHIAHRSGLITTLPASGGSYAYDAAQKVAARARANYPDKSVFISTSRNPRAGIPQSALVRR